MTSPNSFVVLNGKDLSIGTIAPAAGQVSATVDRLPGVLVA
jgi:hypothetical protein